MEIYKDIAGYENLYQVSNMGNIKSLGNGNSNNSNNSKEKTLKLSKNRDGYLKVDLCKEGKVKTYQVHRLVAEAFIENPNNLPQVNHRDEDKTNNASGNLEWCTPKQNINYGSHNQRSAASRINHPKRSKQVLCLETGKIYPSTMEVQRQLGFAQGYISMCCNGRCKQAYGFHWTFLDQEIGYKL
jgi:hypothetical protein